MRNVDTNFDERKFGYSSIVDLLRAAGREGLFRVERDRQGVIRLFPGNVMQQAAEGAETEAAIPGAPRPWQPGDDIPDIHESDRDHPISQDIVEGDVVQELNTPEIVDAQPAERVDAMTGEPSGESAPGARKGRGRGARNAKTPKEPKAAKAPRARKAVATPKPPKAPRAPRARKTASAPAE
jgi:hypothetical protein